MNPTPHIQPIYNADFANAQKVSFTTAEPSANVINADHILIIATADCHIAFGDAPVATTGDPLILKNVYLAFAIESGLKISAVQDSAGGDLYVIPLL